MAGRRCPGERCPRILTQGQRYCPQHALEYEQRRGTPAQRGYDTEHQKLRRTWQARLDAGEIIHCARCGSRINPRAWDLGHTEDRAAWTGPECVGCNRADGGRRGAAISNVSRYE